MSRITLSIFSLLIAFGCAPAFAQAAPTPDISIVNSILAAIVAASGKVLPQAVLWLGSLMGLQFILTNFALLKTGGDIEAVFGKLIGSLAWFGFCIYLLNNGPNFIESVGNGILNKFAANIPTPSSIIISTLGLCALLLAGITAIGTSIIGFGNSSIGMVLVGFFFAVLAIGLYMTVKIVLLYVELALIVALAPLSFSLLGLNALRDQGISPFKSLISLVYRVILLGILCTAFANIADVTYATISKLKWTPGSFGTGLEAVMAAFCAYPILAFLVYKSDSIAASLAGGGSSLGTGDVASAAAAGAAAGAALGSAGGATTNLASKLPQPMASVMGNMMASPGSVQNASGRGLGGASTSNPAGPLASKGADGNSTSFPTNKAGAPQSSSASTQPAPAQSPADAEAAKATEEKNKSQAANGPGSIGPGSSSIDPAKSDRLAEPLNKQDKRSFTDHALTLAQSHAHERSQTNVSINAHQE